MLVDIYQPTRWGTGAHAEHCSWPCENPKDKVINSSLKKINGFFKNIIPNDQNVQPVPLYVPLYLYQMTTLWNQFCSFLIQFYFTPMKQYCLCASSTRRTL